MSRAHEDRTFDYRPNLDPRSLQYDVRGKLPDVTRVQRLWRCGEVLDQGAEGACVGFGWTGEVMAAPRSDYGATFDQGNAFARQLYYTAKTLDVWPGEDYEGTSVLAGAKALMATGAIGEYRWCFDMESLKRTLLTHGPVVVGVDWHESMYDASDGLVSVSGQVVGGHCLLIRGYNPDVTVGGKWGEFFRWRNSWGTGYGGFGDAWISRADLASIVHEMCVPWLRTDFKIEDQ